MDEDITTNLKGGKRSRGNSSSVDETYIEDKNGNA
jgi:hypothetical protein